jgi:hypothetical protein
MAQARFSIREAVAEGFAFWRAHWRKAGAPLAVIGTGLVMRASGATGLTLLGFLVELVGLSVAGAVYYRLALAGLGAEPASNNRPLGMQWGRLEGQLLVTNLLIAAIYAVVVIVSAFMLLALFAGASEGVAPLQLDKPVSPQELMQLLTQEQVTALMVGMAIMMFVCLLVWSRLAMVGPATAVRGAVSVLNTLPLTRGQTFRFAGLWLLIQAPIFLLQIVAVQFGLLMGDPGMAAMANLAVGLVGVFFATPILFGALAHAYRKLNAGGAA